MSARILTSNLTYVSGHHKCNLTVKSPACEKCGLTQSPENELPFSKRHKPHEPLLSEPHKLERQLVIIASTMRSGSTLLKALLARAPDVSNLSEVNFQRFAGNQVDQEKLWGLDAHRILVLKRPAWYHEVARYPRLPNVAGHKVILLVRDVYDTVQSLRKMTFGRAAGVMAPLVDGWLAINYWAGVNARIVQIQKELGDEARLVRYEDLVANPVEVTRELFQFIGSQQREGVDTYEEPENRRWRWGSDDSSPAIRSLQVQPPRIVNPSNARLMRIIGASKKIAELRERLGYSPF